MHNTVINTKDCKKVNLSDDSAFESRIEWANCLRIIYKHYADAFNHIFLKVFWNAYWMLEMKKILFKLKKVRIFQDSFYNRLWHYFHLKFCS